MSDLLARQRLKGNIVDQLRDTQRVGGQIERAAAVVDDDGRVAVAGLLLRVLDAPPPPPPAGHVMVYAEFEAATSTTYLRAMDDEGAVNDLDSWV